MSREAILSLVGILIWIGFVVFIVRRIVTEGAKTKKEDKEDI